MALVSERDRCAHLLRRFGLGASEAEVTYYLQNGLSGAIDRLLNYDEVDEGFTLDVNALRNGKNNRLSVPSVATWWSARLLVTRRPLQEKMTVFWHNHFATSGSKVGQPLLMLAQNELLRRNATGNFRTMLQEISKDPAMLLWLDNQENVAGHANENFAREVMELFTLGIGNYTEKDIQESARAFTGWSFRRVRTDTNAYEGEFLFRPRQHDYGTKTFLGNTGNFSGEDILNMLCDKPRTAVFLTHKLWEWFVYPKPEPAVVDHYAGIFRQSGLDVKTLLRAIMTGEEFYSPRAERAVIKSPVDFVAASLRQLGVGQMVADAIGDGKPDDVPRVGLAPAGAALQAMKAMGMWLLYPPDVSGWHFGPGWISSQTMVERIGWADRIFGTTKAARFPLRYPAYGLLQDDPTPDGVVHKLASVFDARIKPQNRAILVEAARKAGGSRITADNANVTAAAVSRLMFATSEYQFA